MTEPHFLVVFDITSGYRQWWLPVALIGIGLIMGILSLLIRRRVASLSSGMLKSKGFEGAIKLYTIVSWLAGIFFLGGLISFLGTFGNYLWYYHLLTSGKAAYVEGTVDNFMPMPYTGHGSEAFTVKGVPFSYTDYEAKVGFNKSSLYGGPVREGLPVRIWYAGNEILKLEIEENNLQK